jgi:tetratricopeptide (TPR) repeat protein
MAAIMIGRALEHTDPLKWIDGWNRLRPALREDIRRLGPDEARRITLRSGSRFYLDGRVVYTGDSLAVLLFLHDALADTIIGHASAAGPAGAIAAPGLALRATIGLLPWLLPPARSLDREALDFLLDRAPAGVANWLQGEREYRAAQFDSALTHYRRALEADSSLAFAAFKAAQAANWLERDEEGAALVELALRSPPLLPAKHRDFASGLRAYLLGEADSAVASFDRAIARDSGWAEAWAARGEVYYHLLPAGEDLVGTAEASFKTAHTLDSLFAPALFHLTELAVRRGALADARRYLLAYRRTNPVADFRLALDLITSCAATQLPPGVWGRAAVDHPEAVKEAARSLAVGARYPACAEAGFRALLPSASATPAARWAALLGLHNLLVAQERIQDARSLLDSAMAGDLAGGASYLYIIDAVSGYGMDDKAAELIAMLGGRYEQMSAARLWLLGLWAWHHNERQALAEIHRAIIPAAARSNAALDAAFAAGIGVRLRLLEGDTAGAIQALSKLRPSATRPNIAGGLWEALASERLLLAKLYHAQGELRQAARIIAEFDRPQAIMYLLDWRAAQGMLRGSDGALGRREPDRHARS